MTQIFCAIDVDNIDAALDMARALKRTGVHIKLGLEYFVATGPDGIARVRDVMDADAKLFLDLKLHDIPHTVAGAVRAAARCGADFLTLHAAGGADMMTAAQSAAGKIHLLAVTVLTSIAETDTAARVAALARLARDSGMAGAVCSAHEIQLLKKEMPDFVLVVPGIRPAGAPADDQKRVMTPKEASAAGADYLVVGRPITRAIDPALAARQIVASLYDAAA
jgi:orotidine-5'-phosphate decarboxylase